MVNDDKRILLVEDHDDLRCILYDLLMQEGYHVYEACDGSEALRAMERRSFDVVLSDYHLPQMDGLTFLTISRFFWPDTPVILMSSDPELLESATGRAGRAYACLAKPFDLDRLLSVVEEAASLNTHASTVDAQRRL